ncbi:MAG: glycogen/starch synthase [Deltaproteobacteria bacterium]|nr:glycogen/starch synthase [Deltaproteobacteria bacterium]
MRILMLGWEFPPFISGGLGTACYGLTRALDARGHQVLFVLPKAVDRSMASHVDLIAPDAGMMAKADEWIASSRSFTQPGDTKLITRYRMREFEHVEFLGIESPVVSPYAMQSEEADGGTSLRTEHRTQSLEEIEALRAAGRCSVNEELRTLMGGGMVSLAPVGTAGADYSGDVIAASHRYAKLALMLCRHADFEVIHAHDWMTYPAGVALASVTGKPLVAHIHSTEFDRSGEHVNQPIYDIERRGMHAAAKVIAVSMYTKGISARGTACRSTRSR